LIIYLPSTQCRYHNINFLQCLNKTFMITQISLQNHQQGFPSKFETLTKFDLRKKKGTYIKQSDTRGLEGLNKFRLFRMRNSVLSNQHKRGMPCFCASLNYEFSYVSCSSKNQDFALRGHSTKITQL